MEKKVRVKQLNHQDDVKRSWAEVYPLIEDFEGAPPNDLEEVQSKLEEPVENNLPQIQSSVKWQDSVERQGNDISEK